MIFSYSLPTFTLREHQIRGVVQAFNMRKKGKTKPLIVSPTGSGKSKLIIWFTYWLFKSNKKVLIILPKDFILRAFLKDMDALGIDYGIIQAGKKSKPGAPVQIALVWTLAKRELPEADYIFLDECHRFKSKTYQTIWNFYREKIIYGFTGTACRLDGKPLGGEEGFDCLIECAFISELIEREYLVPAVYYGVEEYPDLDGVHIIGGDYSKQSLDEACNTKKLNGEVIESWIQFSEGLPTVFFGASTSHSFSVCENFNKKFSEKYKAIHIDAKTPQKKKEYYLEKFANKEIDWIGNCLLLTEGWDCPGVFSIVDARATLSVSLQRQKGGRGMRPEEGKKDFKYIDLVGNIDRHGFFEDPIEWNLEGKPKLKKSSLPRRCPKCFKWCKGSRSVCICGYTFQTETEGMSPKTIEERKIQLKEIDRLEYKKKDTFISWLRVERGLFPGSKNVGQWAHEQNVLLKRNKPIDPFFKLLFDEEKENYENEISKSISDHGIR